MTETEINWVDELLYDDINLRLGVYINRLLRDYRPEAKVKAAALAKILSERLAAK